MITTALSLVTKASSSILINPDIPEALQLRSWLVKNIDAVNEVMTSEEFKNFGLRSNAEPERQIVQVLALEGLPHNETYVVKCFLKVTEVEQILWYMSCSNCHRSTTGQHLEVFDCSSCKRKNVNAVPRCRLSVKVSDATGSVSTILFGDHAGKILSCSAVVLMKSTPEETINRLNSLVIDENHKEYLVQVKPFYADSRGEVVRKYGISSITDVVPSPEPLVVEEPVGMERGENSSSTSNTTICKIPEDKLHGEEEAAHLTCGKKSGVRRTLEISLPGNSAVSALVGDSIGRGKQILVEGDSNHVSVVDGGENTALEAEKIVLVTYQKKKKRIVPVKEQPLKKTTKKRCLVALPKSLEGDSNHISVVDGGENSGIKLFLLLVKRKKRELFLLRNSP